jgi:hypothetical protein
VEEVSSSLASDDVFVLETVAHTWIWQGKVRSYCKTLEYQFFARRERKEAE